MKDLIKDVSSSGCIQNLSYSICWVEKPSHCLNIYERVCKEPDNMPNIQLLLDATIIIVTVIKKIARELSYASKKSEQWLKFNFKMFREFLLFPKREKFTKGILAQ